MYTALRTFCLLWPTRFDCEAMTFPEMTVRAMDEILLRTEISGRGEEEDSARDVQTGPAWVRPRQARPSRSGRGEEGFSARRPNGPGVGTAATSAALPLRKRGGGIQRATSKRARRGYGRDKRGPPAQEEGRRDSARDVQTGPAWVRPRQARPSRSGRGEEGDSARRPNGPGVGTAATSAALPPRKNRDKGVNGEWAAFWRLA